MKEGKTLTFIELIDEVDLIQIPIIQRDYAQGRGETTEVRRQFISSIKQSLLKDDLNTPLSLDFVYGNFEGQNHTLFSVLDGQQRLTTLFLLHWYLATKEDCLISFRKSFVSDTRSKFTYKTRVSASEFFNALANANDVFFDCEKNSISDLIIDKQWFFLSWKCDPTVQSCLTMLDEMHQQFSDCKKTLYERLTDKKAPRIVFQYLNLESFGLSDELYIKMNARGRPLSDFENFKAWLCSQLEEKPDGKDIESKIDQGWTDIIWIISRDLKSIDDFDKLYLRFFHLMAFYRACESIVGSYEALDDSNKLRIQTLRSSTGYIPIDNFETFSTFDNESLDRIELVLDYFLVNKSNNDILQILKDAVTSNDYVNQAKFYAFVKFIQGLGKVGKWTVENEKSFSRWNRVTDNLINNHRIDELSSFIPSIRSLSKLSVNSENLYDFLVKSGIDSGFTKEQREEESLKASLILSDPNWESLLIQFEKHSYLKGKVGFLLKMATSSEDDSTDQVKFKKMASKAGILLGDKIISSNDFLLQRALLVMDDYLVQDSGHRYSFCVPNRSTYRERSENWLRVVKEQVFENLLGKIGTDIEISLRNIINSADCHDWRKLVIENPDVIDYCSKRLIHKEGNLIYLLSKSTFRGYHAELRTFILEKSLKEMRKEKTLPDEISNFNYVEVYGNDTAYTLIELNNKDKYKVYFESNGFIAWDNEDEPNQQEMPEVLTTLINKIFPDEVVQGIVEALV